MGPNTSFWRDKRVLITGHTGFKGSWLGLWLHLLGARVVGYALAPPTQPSLYELAKLDQLVSSTIGDVRNLDHLSRVVDAFAPEVVFHMAAQSAVLRSYDDPVESFSTNVLGTVNVLEAIRRARRPCAVLNVTTDKCYANRNWVWGYRENDRLGGCDPYSSSKACAELVAQSYRDSFFGPTLLAQHGVGIASARAGNVIGGGDWTPRQLIPDAVAALARRQPVLLRHPHAVRPWQHALDCLAGYLSLAEALANDAGAYSGEWNFGPVDADTLTVCGVVERLAVHWGVAAPWVQDAGSYPPEEQALRLDSSKAASLLQWRCRLSIDASLRQVADWYLAYAAGDAPRSLCFGQIHAYMGALNEAGSKPGG